MNTQISKDRIETLYESRFLKCYDLQYAEGKHYYVASRREKADLVAKMTDEEAKLVYGIDCPDKSDCVD